MKSENPSSDSISIEKSAYEIGGLWDEGLFGEEEDEKAGVLTSLIPDDVTSLLDVGCGNGHFLHFLQNSSRGSTLSRLCGIDRSVSALSHLKTEKHQGEIGMLPFSDKEFDILTCNNVLEHLPIDVYSKALDEIVRVAKKSIIITLPYKEDLKFSQIACPYCYTIYNPNYHLRHYDELAMKHLFGDRQVKCLSTRPIVMRPVRPLWLSRLSAIWRLWVLDPASQLPFYAVCPMCGYKSPKSNAHQAQVSSEAMGSGWRALVRQLLPITRQERWIVGVYQVES